MGAEQQSVVPPYHILPCVLLARLAVQRDIQGRGIGSALLKSAFDLALDVKASVGCRLMIIDAYETAVTFYEQFGFEPLPKVTKRETIKMVLDLNTVEAARRPENVISLPRTG